MANYECARCHRFFNKVAFEEVCPACFPVEEEEFRRIKEYLTRSPGASSNEVMQAIGASLKSIKRYLKEDRLEIVGENKGFIRCELCGRPLNSGRFCDGCFKEGQAKRLQSLGQGKRGAYIGSQDKEDGSQKTSIKYREVTDKKR